MAKYFFFARARKKFLLCESATLAVGLDSVLKQKQNVSSAPLQEYATESIDTGSIDPPNNKPTLDLIGAAMGIFQLLSDQAKCCSLQPSHCLKFVARSYLFN